MRKLVDLRQLILDNYGTNQLCMLAMITTRLIATIALLSAGLDSGGFGGWA